MKIETYKQLAQLDRIEYNQLKGQITFNSLTLFMIYVLFTITALVSIITMLLYQITGNIESLGIIKSLLKVSKPILCISMGLDIIGFVGHIRRIKKLDKEFLDGHNA
tara:strand:+ start:455 stop:775 length:321 start_codon:yes stop_codon:yes gene_type:complete